VSPSKIEARRGESPVHDRFIKLYCPVVAPLELTFLIARNKKVPIEREREREREREKRVTNREFHVRVARISRIVATKSR